MVSSNNSVITRPLTMVAGFDHLTAIVSDGNGRFPGRCDTFSISRNLSQIQVSSEEISRIVSVLESDLRERFVDVYFFSEFPVVSCFQSIFEVSDELCRQSAGGVSVIADSIWNHYYDHAERMGIEQFHVSLVTPLDEESVPGSENLKLNTVHLTSFASTKEIVSGILTPVNRTGLRVKQLLNLSTAKAISGGMDSRSDYLCLDIGWRVSELSQISGGRVCHISSIPIGLFHFANDVAISQNFTIENALSLIRQSGFGFGVRPGPHKSEVASRLDTNQIRMTLESRVQEFIRFLSKHLKRHTDTSVGGLTIPLNFSGHRIPGLWELVSLVFGTTCKTSPDQQVEFFPKYTVSSDKSLSTFAVSEISAALSYVNLALKTEALAYDRLLRIRKTSFSSSKSKVGWLRELL
jgi:hypothetical protein